MENSKLRADLTNLRKTVADNVPGKSAEELMSKYNYLVENFHLCLINVGIKRQVIFTRDAYIIFILVQYCNYY